MNKRVVQLQLFYECLFLLRLAIQNNGADIQELGMESLEGERTFELVYPITRCVKL